VSAVAVIGLGAMGSRIAGRLVDAGHDVVVWNRTPAKAEPLVERGATAAATPADAARRADAVLTMVADPHALRAVTEGPDGLAAGADEETTVIEMSTVGPAAVAWLAEALPPGTGLLDAPVLGSLTEAEAGSLSVFVGGPDSLVEEWTPLLTALGTVRHVGPLGAGAATKLVANTTLVGTLGLLGEALALAQGLGLSREAAFEVLALTPLAGQSKRRRAAVESGEFPRRFSLALARKDAELIVEAAADAGVDVRLLAGAASWFRDADEESWGERDYSAILARILAGEP
jgi:3-hydroxyisobutyrate dehydrogenase-like beta-hydroxyacid dehydrogenase